MPDIKTSDLDYILGADTSVEDQFLILDVSDTSQGAGGTLKRISRPELISALSYVFSSDTSRKFFVRYTTDIYSLDLSEAQLGDVYETGHFDTSLRPSSSAPWEVIALSDPDPAGTPDDTIDNREIYYPYNLVTPGKICIETAESSGLFYVLEITPNTGGYITVTALGARGVGLTFDDTKAFHAAAKVKTLAPIRDEYASTYSVVIPLVSTFYYLTSDWIIQRNIVIEASGAHGRSLGAAQIKFSDDCIAGIWLQHPGGVSAPSPYDTELGDDAYGAGRSIIRNLNISPVNEGAVSFGILHNLPVTLEYVHAMDFNLANFFAHGQSSGDTSYGDPNEVGGFGTMFGNTNASLYMYCIARNSPGTGAIAGHGFVAQGNNTQIMTYINCDASGNRGCGFRDNSSIGNHYTNCHTAQNTIKIYHGAQYYMPIKPHTSDSTSEPGVGADWQEFWIESTATIDGDAWATATDYGDSGGINIVETDGNFPTITGHYTEGGIEYGVIPRGATTVHGGVAIVARTYSEGPDANSVFVSSGLSATPSKWSGKDDTDGWGSSLGSVRNNYDFFQCGHTEDPDCSIAGVNGVSLTYSKVRSTYEFIKGSGARTLAFTTDNWGVSPYAGSDHIYFEEGLIVGGPKATYLQAAYASGVGISGEVKKGQIYFMTNAAAGGKALAYVTTAGTVGSTAVIKEAAAIDV